MALAFTRREVFKAKHRQTGKKVALKKVLMENEKEGVSSLNGQVVFEYAGVIATSAKQLPCCFCSRFLFGIAAVIILASMSCFI